MHRRDHTPARPGRDRHRRPLRGQRPRRVRPHPDDGRLRDQLDRERDRAQQRQEQHPGRGRDGNPPVPVPGHLLRLRQRHRVHQRRTDRLAAAKGHRTDPQPPVQEERPGHGRVAQQPRRQEIRVLLAL